jgi:lycopene cyclase domain-containing protein
VTYWLLNTVFLTLVAAVVVLAVLRRRHVRWAAVAGTMVVLLLMTAVFDNIMIGVGLVGYNPGLISNVFVGIAPLEDFAYAVAAVLLLPALWSLLPATRTRADRSLAATKGQQR